MVSILSVCLGLLVLAPVAQAQFIGCDPVTNPCTAIKYGLGNPPCNPREGFSSCAQEPFGLIAETAPQNVTVGITRLGAGSDQGVCGPEEYFRIPGQIRIREQDDCVVSSSNRCLVETPQVPEESGTVNSNRADFPFPGFGIVAVSANLFNDFGGNVGFRQLSGTCTDDADEECALDSQCGAGTGCFSTCFSDPDTLCASHADCKVANDCRTEVEWDGIGTCEDDTTVCTSDDDCVGLGICEAGFESVDSPQGCLCCHSSLGTFCGLSGWGEYPALTCPVVESDGNHIGYPDWLFQGGRGTRWDPEVVIHPNQQEGICKINRTRACGARGDLFSGGANGKCTFPGECAVDPLDPANPALPSGCDDVFFGGMEGDFCDFGEDFVRLTIGQGRNPDGSADPLWCPQNLTRFVGFPNTLCARPTVFPQGDPLPGCRLVNFGVGGGPDIDCNGILDYEEGRCMPVGGVYCGRPEQCPPCSEDTECDSGNCINDGNLCPFTANFNWFQDTNGDNIGDLCQCGDFTTELNPQISGDGVINALDIGGAAQCANGVVACPADLVDADGNGAVNALDVGAIAQVANGVIPSTSLLCLRNCQSENGRCIE